MQQSNEHINSVFSSSQSGHNDIISSDHVRVVVRCRPLDCTREEDSGSVLNVNSERNTVEVKVGCSSLKTYRFNCVAHEQKDQEYIFDQTGKPIVDCALAGFNGAIVTYGQTGSGKTYTMQGAQSLGIAASPIPPMARRKDQDGRATKGIIQMVCESIFQAVNHSEQNEQQSKLTVKASYLEIYNEMLIDLLSSCGISTSSSTSSISTTTTTTTTTDKSRGNNNNSNNFSSSSSASSMTNKPKLSIREDINGAINVVGLTQYEVDSPERCYQLLRAGAERRKVATTKMNLESSRSHAVFTLLLSRRDNETGLIRTSRLHLVDLAGSERQKSTGASGARLREAGGINKSLSALGNVINSISSNNGFSMSSSLSSSSTSSSRQQQQQQRNQRLSSSSFSSSATATSTATVAARVPSCRESKLTFLLKDAFGGNSKLCIIATISPALQSIDETVSTLEFAQRCTAIKNMAVVNESLSSDVEQLQSEVRRLQQSLRMAHVNLSHSAAGTLQFRRKVNAPSLKNRQTMTTSCTMTTTNTDDVNNLPNQSDMSTEKNDLENHGTKDVEKVSRIDVGTQPEKFLFVCEVCPIKTMEMKNLENDMHEMKSKWDHVIEANQMLWIKVIELKEELKKKEAEVLKLKEQECLEGKLNTGYNENEGQEGVGGGEVARKLFLEKTESVQIMDGEKAEEENKFGITCELKEERITCDTARTDDKKEVNTNAKNTVLDESPIRVCDMDWDEPSYAKKEGNDVCKQKVTSFEEKVMCDQQENISTTQKDKVDRPKCNSAFSHSSSSPSDAQTKRRELMEQKPHGNKKSDNDLRVGNATSASKKSVRTSSTSSTKVGTPRRLLRERGVGSPRKTTTTNCSTWSDKWRQQEHEKKRGIIGRFKSDRGGGSVGHRDNKGIHSPRASVVKGYANDDSWISRGALQNMSGTHKTEKENGNGNGKENMDSSQT